MNASTATSRLIVERCLAHGVKHVVIAPGSRSAPLSWAFAQAEKLGALKVHVRIDERDAGFLALGLAKASGTPVPVVVTSGSAVANLLPAIVEAHQSSIPVIALSADRPDTIRGKSAPQTINQAGIFGNFVRAQLDSKVGALTVEALDGALAATIASRPGPIQLNVQFDMPLLPTGDDMEWKLGVSEVEKIHNDVPRTQIELPARGLVLIGDCSDSKALQEAGALASTLGWPIITEPTSNAHSFENSLSHGVLLIQSGKLPTPEAILTLGTVGLSRATLALLKQSQLHIAIHAPTAGPDEPDPVLSAKQILNFVPTAEVKVDPTWLASWKSADLAVQEIVTQELAAETLSGPSAAITVWNKAQDEEAIFVAASWPVRHLEAYAKVRSGLTVFGNRGANGIDGLISTAWGVAAARTSRTYLLMGDIAFLHDVGGLNVSETEVQPPLTIVVLDNDGSGIFSQLEQGGPEYREHFEKVFGTPHGKDLWVIAESMGIPAKRVTTKTELEFALTNSATIPGVNVIVCTTGQRSNENELIKKIATKVSDAL